jgi:hypothetical protein
VEQEAQTLGHAPADVVLAFNEALNRHDVPAMMALMSDSCRFANTSPSPDGEEFVGQDAVTGFWLTFFEASREAHIEIEEIFSCGERCTMRWRYQWRGEDGTMSHVRGVDVYRVTNGLIDEKLSYVKG